MRTTLVVLFCLVASASCSKHPAADGSYPPLRVAAQDNACTADKDCVISCRHNGTCCDQTCHCGTAYARTFLSRLDARHREYCRDRKAYKCVHPDCGASATRSVARCTKGRCVSVQVPNH
ncbi:MAG: hypothetical protein KC503_13920 [Myxococcales bacterium]|nr:hypothetical protein [Myxococcales bacterium]